MIDFTTVVGVDEAHLEELRLTWPTWARHRPELLVQPLLLVCDGDRTESFWRARLPFSATSAGHSPSGTNRAWTSARRC